MLRTPALLLAATGIAVLGLGFGSSGAVADSLPWRSTGGMSMLAQASPGQDLIQLSDDGFRAVREMQAARLAIFEGAPAEAEKLLGRARASLGEAGKLADKLAHKGKSGPGVTYIPIDAELTVADDLVYTPEKVERIKQVNEHLKKGENKAAIEMLRGGEIVVNVALALLPLQATEKAIDKAAKLIADGKYYEANLTLKTAVDGVIIDSVSLIELFKVAPAEGKKG